MPRVALTFDDGPGEWTPPILDALGASGARATFFVVGSIAEQRGEIVERALAEGHEIGNHTWSHPWLARDCDDGRIRDELARTNELLARFEGLELRRFRAPHYDVDERVLAIGESLGLEHTHGDVAPPDWDARCTTPFIAAYVLGAVRDGAVVGLHDGIPRLTRAPGESRLPTAEAVAKIVPELRRRGYELVTASELLSGAPAASARTAQRNASASSSGA